MYFIGRKAITNAFRHADASAIKASVEYGPTELTVTFHDDGCGFHTVAEGGKPQAGHWGIAGMMEPIASVQPSNSARRLEVARP